MNCPNALIIFVKNPVPGKVKTRLAAKVGNDAAFEIYKMLLTHTKNITKPLKCDKYVFYSQFIDENDSWQKHNYTKCLQTGKSLGERIQNAIIETFAGKNYNGVVIIGSDCAELTSSIVEHAFEVLSEVDIVIGPATDGGYYLLGLKKMEEDLFRDIQWSTSSVLYRTLSICLAKGLSHQLLPMLNDIDEEEDWIKFCAHQSTLHEK